MTPIDLERIEMQSDILKGNCWGYCAHSGQGWAGLLTTGFCVQVDSFYNENPWIEVEEPTVLSNKNHRDRPK